jgi:hypothetical protein
VDGSPIPRAAITVPVKVDPGVHEVSLTGDGGHTAVEVTVVEREVRDVECKLPTPSGLVVAPTPSPATRPTSASRRISPSAIASFGVAVAGLGLGTAGGIVAVTDKGSLEKVCHGGFCPITAASEVRSADAWAAVSTVSFVVAATACTVGIVFLVVRSPHSGSAWRRALGGQVEF